MNKIWIFIIGGVFILLLVFYLTQKPASKSTITSSKTANMLTVTSTAFNSGETVPKKYTCAGEDINPPLTVEGVPTGAKSLALIVDDPDAPAGTWTHWLVWNIDPTIREIGENAVPVDAAFGTNDFGKLEYGGPCPPSGTHRYFFRLFALDTTLDLPQGAKREELEAAIKDHIIAQGELMGKYSR